MTENIFSYGTLQTEAVQFDTFGRLLVGIPDTIVGYKLTMIKIEDEKVIASSGAIHHPIIKHTGNYSDTVEGTVFKISETELKQADNYEVGAYKRVLVQLKSGKNAWVYIDAT